MCICTDGVYMNVEVLTVWFSLFLISFLLQKHAIKMIIIYNCIEYTNTS